MSRPTVRKKSQTAKAIIELRRYLGDSQQDFSNRLGMALNTVAKWEMGREPSGVAWLEMLRVADESHHSAASYFASKFFEENPSLISIGESLSRRAKEVRTQ